MNRDFKAAVFGGALLVFAGAARADEWNVRAPTPQNDASCAAPLSVLLVKNGPTPAKSFQYQLLLRNAIAGYQESRKIDVVFPNAYGTAARHASGAGRGKENRVSFRKAASVSSREGGNDSGRAALRGIAGNRAIHIGVNEAPAKLDVTCDVTVQGDNWGSGEDARINLGDENHYIRAIWGEGVRIGTFGAYDAIVVKQASGNVGIGTANPGSCKLAVEGKIGAREVVVTLSEWPDFVFSDGYKPPPLDSVAGYIERNKHLEGIPSGKKIASSGVPIGEMQAALLQKIEELTLYMIELNKENRRLTSDLRDLERRIMK